MNKRLAIILLVIVGLGRGINAQTSPEAVFVLPATTENAQTAQPFVVLPSGLVAVMNDWANSVGVVNLNERTLVAEVPLTDRPTSLAYVPSLKALVVSVQGSPVLTLIDAVSFELLANPFIVDVPADAVQAGVRLIGVRDSLLDLLIGSRLAVFDIGTRATIFGDTLPASSAASVVLWGGLRYTVDQDGMIGLVAGTHFTRLPQTLSAATVTDLPQASLPALNPRDRELYVPLTQRPAGADTSGVPFDQQTRALLLVVDLTTFTVRATLPLEVSDGPWHLPSAVALNTERTRLFITYAASNRLSVLDRRSQQRIATMETGANPSAVGFSRDNLIVFTVNTEDASLSLFETRLFGPLDTVRTTTVERPPELARGAWLFHSAADASVAWNNSLSCNTCHHASPADDTALGLAAISRVLADQSDDDLRAFLIEHIVNVQGGSGLNTVDTSALIAYLRSLP